MDALVSVLQQQWLPEIKHEPPVQRATLKPVVHCSGHIQSKSSSASLWLWWDRSAAGGTEIPKSLCHQSLLASTAAPPWGSLAYFVVIQHKQRMGKRSHPH